MLGLSGRAKDQVGKFSGGMKRRLSVAMALVSNPQVLFLDEPTIGLDPQSRRGIWEYIERLKGDKTIVLTTHYLEEADALADRIAVIDEGKIVALGSPSDLKKRIAGDQSTVIDTENITEEAIVELRKRYSGVRVVAGGIEIDDDDVSLYEIEDCLRPMGVVVTASYKKQATLDDVFIDLTGKELRE